MRLMLALAVSFTCLHAIAGERPQEIRFCPGDLVRTYPLDSRGRVQSLLVPHVAVINHAATAFTVTALDFELLEGGQVVDARHFDAADVQRFVTNGPDIEEVSCGNELIAHGIKLAGPELHAQEGLLVTNQVFAFNERRDTLRVRAEGTSAGRPAQLTATLPVSSDIPRTGWLFPVRGVSYVGWGPSLHTAHRWALSEAFALDIARLGGVGLTYRNDGARFSDYFAYGAEVRAAASGKVLETANDVPEDQSLLQLPNESTDAYTARVRENQARMVRVDGGLMGNHVIIDHGHHEYSVYAHLQPGSVSVRPGEILAAGALLGRLGSSGNSTEPHLHFHVCSGPTALQCDAVPVSFDNVKVLWAETDRPLQSGDIVIAK